MIDRNQAKDIARSRLGEYLVRTRGINLNKAFCCINPAHRDRHPSMRFYDNADGQAVHCFACGAHYDIFDVIGIDESLSLSSRELFDRTYQLLGIDVSNTAVVPVRKPVQAEPVRESHEAYLTECAARAAQTDYWHCRGLSDATIARFNLGFDPNYSRGTGGQRWQAAILPAGEGSFVARNTDPEAEASARYRKTGPAQLFNVVALDGDAPTVMVVEGEIDALSVEDVGIPCVGLGSVANAGKLVQAARERIEAGRGVPQILIAMDADEAGRRAAEGLLQGLHEAGVEAAVAKEVIFGGFKDANEALVNNRTAFYLALKAALAAVQPAGIYTEKYGAVAALDGFLGAIADRVNTRCVPTGFHALDQALDGGLYEGLHVIGSVSSNGKTTFVLQMADQMAAMGQDVLIFSLEMAKNELIAKSISRQTILLAQEQHQSVKLAKAVREITDAARWASYTDAELQLINDAIDRYAGYAGRIFMVEGVGSVGVHEVRRITEEHIRVIGRKPVVIIDYLQILAPFSERLSDKQNTDKNVLELKRLSRDCKISVVAISSFNRMGYHQEVSHEFFKESGAVEYSADTLFGIQLKGIGKPGFDVKMALQKTPRELELVVLKNRNGMTGMTLNFDYYPKFNYMKES